MMVAVFNAATTCVAVVRPDRSLLVAVPAMTCQERVHVCERASVCERACVRAFACITTMLAHVNIRATANRKYRQCTALPLALYRHPTREAFGVLLPCVVLLASRQFLEWCKCLLCMLLRLVCTVASKGAGVFSIVGLISVSICVSITAWFCRRHFPWRQKRSNRIVVHGLCTCVV